MQFQIFSDIHIEKWNKVPHIPVLSKYLILAGDICQLEHPLFFSFLDYCSNNWYQIFYIPGNHEFYSHKKNYNELNFEYNYRIREKYKNIFYLNNDFMKIEEHNIFIYGATFWTNPPFTSTYSAKNQINDYNCIKYFNNQDNTIKKLDIEYVRQLSNESLHKLTEFLNNNNNNNQAIIVTHFPPIRTGTSHPKVLTQKKITNLYFSWSDDTPYIFNTNNILAWVSGHTHYSYDFVRDDIRFISNQVGYINETEDTRLNTEGVFIIDNSVHQI